MDDAMQMYPLPSGDARLATKITASIWVMASISTIFLALRIYCRSTRAGKLWWDDALLITSWVFLITSVGLQTEMYRLGYLVTALSGPELSPRNLASDSTMKLALAFAKSSFALTVAKLASGWTWTRWAVVVVAVVMNSAMLIHGVLVWRTNCGYEEPWTFRPCWSPYSGIWMNMVGSIISAVTDFILVLLPLSIIRKLQMNKMEKIGIAICMSIGIFAGAVSIVKAVESYEVTRTVGTAFSYRLSILSIMVNAEPNAAIVASSIPILRTLFRDIARQYGSGRSGGKSGQYIKSNEQCSFPGASTTTKSIVTAAKPEYGSEISILPPDAEKRIKQTKQVAVEYDESDGSSPGRGWGRRDIEMGDYATHNTTPRL